MSWSGARREAVVSANSGKSPSCASTDAASGAPLRGRLCLRGVGAAIRSPSSCNCDIRVTLFRIAHRPAWATLSYPSILAYRQRNRKPWPRLSSAARPCRIHALGPGKELFGGGNSRFNIAHLRAIRLRGVACRLGTVTERSYLLPPLIDVRRLAPYATATIRHWCCMPYALIERATRES